MTNITIGVYMDENEEIKIFLNKYLITLLSVYYT